MSHGVVTTNQHDVSAELWLCCVLGRSQRGGVGEWVVGAGSESWVLLFLPVPGPPFPDNTKSSFVMITKPFFN